MFLPIYIEATPLETEARLLKGIRKVCPDMPIELNLVDTLASLRRGHGTKPGQKVLLIIDQFEQWLFARRAEQNTELVAGLRQCDGGRVQAIVMVRDDFWMAATRFMRGLEIRLVEGENSTAVDLFDLLHARRVLTAFGRAYGVLPEKSSELSTEQRAFVEQSVAGLAQDGKVISVRLALFAEMVKGKAWSPATLREVGGTQGVGVRSSKRRSVRRRHRQHRLHQKAAQAVLKALLPETGTDIKGQMRSEALLREASGYADRPGDFDDVIGILDAELRLITPTDPEGTSGEAQPAGSAGQRFYQLTHDYMVNSLRDWLTRRLRETRRGRAQLRLAERAALWDSKPENRYLPSAQEWVSIRTMTSPKEWTEPQQRMMRRARQVHGVRTMGVAALTALLFWGGLEVYGSMRASGFVDSLKIANITDVRGIVGRIAPYRRRVDPRLRSLLEDAESSTREKLNARLALLPVDRSQVPYLEETLLGALASELPVLRDALIQHRADLIPKLWTVLEAAKPDDHRVLPAAAALALYDPANAKWEAAAQGVASALVAVNPIHLGSWIDAMRAVKGNLTDPLKRIFQEKNRRDSEHALATNILVEYGGDDPQFLAELLMIADPTAYRSIYDAAAPQAERYVSLFQGEIAKPVPALKDPAADVAAKEELAQRKARAAVALLRMGKAEIVWPLLGHSPDPRLRSFVINWLKPLSVEPKIVAKEFRTPEHFRDPRTGGATARGSRMSCLMLRSQFEGPLSSCWARLRRKVLSAGDRERLAGMLFELYRDDPDSGIHGAAQWTLRQWKEFEKLKTADAEPRTLKELGPRRWFVNSEGQTLAIIEGPSEFQLGSPESDIERPAVGEPVCRMSIPRRFCMATTEVTVEQFRKFAKQDGQFKLNEDQKKAL